MLGRATRAAWTDFTQPAIRELARPSATGPVDRNKQERGIGRGDAERETENPVRSSPPRLRARGTPSASSFRGRLEKNLKNRGDHQGAVRHAASALLAPFRKRRAAPLSEASSGEAPARAPIPRQPLPEVPVLLVSQYGSDGAALQQVLRGSRYMVVHADDLDHAARLLGHIVFPIILYACHNEADWQPALGRLLAGWRIPSIVLLAETYSQTFWEDSICRGVFDVLSRPLRADDILTVLDFAYTSWTLGLGVSAPGAAVAACE
jgi:hypothetical protein